MAIRGKFTVSSGHMVGSYTDRTFNYEVVKWVKKDEYRPTDQKVRTRITEDQLGEAEAVYLKITNNKDEEEYRYLWGPFPGGEQEIETQITDIYSYGSA